ncbi:hypothetical protein TNIN_193381 [Trichonephila inaurata madagascariensis]|uniref:Uncharacterized protein n=1 Tax=Trichonephila inaurata madagascariensis TaxID=2747483 RepID=A0A8X6Y8A1_9ARAC|nr:hypothetical protein TNIN_193381 [Trichonephila inaurata madagascariensis]
MLPSPLEWGGEKRNALTQGSQREPAEQEPVTFSVPRSPFLATLFRKGQLTVERSVSHCGTDDSCWEFPSRRDASFGRNENFHFGCWRIPFPAVFPQWLR